MKYKLIAPDILKEMYCQQEIPSCKIAEHFNVPNYHIANLLRKYNIPSRSRSEASKLAHKWFPHREALSFAWRGGRSIKEGYVVVRLKPEDDCFISMCWSKGKSRNCYDLFEHRLVMAKHLGRCLLPTEQVHHINNNKTDNRIENLTLYSAVTHHKNLHPTVVCPHCHRQFVLVKSNPIDGFF